MNTPVELKPHVDGLRKMIELHRAGEDLSGHRVPCFEAPVRSVEAVLDALTRPPASAAPVDELVETTSRSATLTARSIANHIRDHKDDPHLANIIIWLCDSLDEAADQLTVYARRVAEKDAALREIDKWTAAYPVAVFPEPDLDRVTAVLTEAGMREQVDRMHASWARHLLSGVGDIARGRIRRAESAYGWRLR